MVTEHRAQRYERADVAVCWRSSRQAWLLINVSDRQARTASGALFVEVFTQALDDDHWQWRAAYYPDDNAQRRFWAHQFAEHATPTSFDLRAEEIELGQIRPPQEPGAGESQSFVQRLLTALRR